MEATPVLVDDTWQKILVVVLAAALGWVVGQGGKLYDEWRTRKRLKRQLHNELKHVQDSLKMAHQDFLRTLQLSVKNIAEVSTSQQFSHPIYENFYKDICSHLNKSQRASFDRIHQLIDAMNRVHHEQSDFAKSLYLEPTTARQRWWFTLAQFQYGNIRSLDYLIAYHCHNPEIPNIELGEISHMDYLKYDQSISDEILEIVEEAKTIDPKTAFVKYHPDMFSHLHRDDSNE